jgi:RNA polymerase sigma-70 factor (ECF subfamily)
MIADASSPDKAVTEKDKLRMLIHEIDRLPQKQSMVLKMRAIEGLEYDEISQRTGLSQVNIRVLISIARKTLKNNLCI